MRTNTARTGRVAAVPLVLALVAAVVAGCGSAGGGGGGSGGGSGEGPINIGLTITKTGNEAGPATFELQGYELAVREINASGGLLGRRVKLTSHDDQGDASVAVKRYQRFTSSDDIDLLLGPYQTDLVAAIGPIVSRAKMVTVTLGANVPQYRQYPYLVQGITQTGNYMNPVVDLAAAKGYKTMALLVQDTQFPRKLAEGVVKAAKAKGIRIVFNETYPADTTNFTPLVLKAARSHPDVILGATYVADSIGIVKAARAQGVNAKMFAFSIGPVEPEFQQSLGKSAEGILGSTLWFPTLPTKGNDDFVKAFKKKFGREPDYHAAVAYSAMRTLAAAVEKVGSLDQDAIRKTLITMKRPTVVGTFDVNSDRIQVGYGAYALQWQNGDQELVWPKKDQTKPVQLPHENW